MTIEPSRSAPLPPPPPPPPPPKPKAEVPPKPVPKPPDDAAGIQAARELGSLHGGIANADGPGAMHAQAALFARVPKITAEEAKQELGRLDADLKQATNPQDVRRLSDRANEVMGRVTASSLPAEVGQRATAMRDQLDTASQSVQALKGFSDALAGSPTGAANATAQLLGKPAAFDTAIKGLKALQDSPVIAGLKLQADAIARQASPAALTQQLTAQSDLKAYPPDMAANLAALRQANDPALQTAIDQVGTTLLNQKGGVGFDQVKNNPAIGQLLAPLANSPDAKVKGLLADAAKGWAKASLASALDGKQGKDGVKAAMSTFHDQMTSLAQSTGMGPAIAPAMQQALKDDNGKIKDVANKGKSWWQSALDDVGSVVGNVVGGVVGLAGTVVDDALKGAGKVAGGVVHLAGEGLALEGHLVADGLDVVGAHGAAKAVNHASDDVAAVAKAAGHQVDEFGQGMGDAFRGMADGTKFMIQHPIMAVKGMANMAMHPSLLVAAGKTMWAEAMKGGYGHAAGYIAGNLVPMLFSGGAADGTMLGRVASSSRLASVVGDTAMTKLSSVATMTGRSLEVVRGLHHMDFDKIGEGVSKFRVPFEPVQGARLTASGARAGVATAATGTGHALASTALHPLSTAGNLATRVVQFPGQVGSKVVSIERAAVSGAADVRARIGLAREVLGDKSNPLSQRIFATEQALGHKGIDAAMANRLGSRQLVNDAEHLSDFGVSARDALRALRARNFSALPDKVSTAVDHATSIKHVDYLTTAVDKVGNVVSSDLGLEGSFNRGLRNKGINRLEANQAVFLDQVLNVNQDAVYNGNLKAMRHDQQHGFFQTVISDPTAVVTDPGSLNLDGTPGKV